ncbi:hypothetical protein MTsPCn9_18370 [Croceitalea sp. MTPC9]|uniref:hypothetical protein n=1 Tax=unclassified Croceitalea TaxID=2632280 RepID=UPI002B3F5A97|nr:hypothetical protein MTsPCn6_11220 [Croceitalea sp. MTPC6]GMN16901.1 hypothetical protein MTsPCn9_18370 [Croceitalea sp. MTPC9]
MKKLFFATALVLGSLTVVAASNTMIQDEISVEVKVSEFKEISASDLPAAVVKALETDYAGATINKAYVNEEGQYKLEVTTQDGTDGTLYADAEGNWLEM